MPYVDVKKRLIHLKIVYYGTGMGGKTTNLKYLYEKTDPKLRGKMMSLATQTDRTLFFDFVPMALGKIKGMDTRFNFYTVPGQSFYNLSRKAILKDVDGLVFVADSQTDRFEANVDSFLNLQENLAEMKLTLSELPHVIQYNKRDLNPLTPLEDLRRELNKHNVPDFEAVATVGTGVMETIRAAIQLVVAKATKTL
ncbi:MAG: gliding-motility protein MglA [Deltaproteobacteria bacterium]|nr:gliding-motility protein MglA [Deltaproteobacteria bacterium]